MAALVAIGGDGLARVAAARALGGEGGTREEGIGAGLRPRLLGVARRPRGREAGRVEVARACAVPSFSSAYWQEVEDEAAPGGLGRRWAGQLDCDR